MFVTSHYVGPRGAALCRNRVASHGVHIGNKGNLELGICFGNSDGGAHSCTSAPHKKDIVR